MTVVDILLHQSLFFHFSGLIFQFEHLIYWCSYKNRNKPIAIYIYKNIYLNISTWYNSTNCMRLSVILF